ncbi:helix-turn-helix domain-containing protein [Nocardia cyriacigeorgica]|uniref:helix-turn-helix domain-containing protein n=1 Tax=Nocardia cyriacigeorgica TaxID=135487 RepID=UPI0018963938|nr:XRE family transcriptional regulator [Nocardia cyriacigeorgica]MBF6414305.1 helix-turn-helix domain-containing protein [Nocardia cyriacigeorgica]
MAPLKENDDVVRFSNGLTFPDLGRRVRAARLARDLTLQELADAAQVSRSMVSEVERGTKVPTVLVLDRIAGALGTSVARLLDTHRTEPAVVLRSADHRTQSDATGWTWTLMSPALPDHGLQLVRGVAPPNTSGPLFPAHAAGSREWLIVERGRLSITVGEDSFDLMAGDSIAYVGDLPHRMANPGDSECTYFLAMDHLGRGGGYH